MIWHEIVCDKCSNVLTGFSGLKNYNARLKQIEKKQDGEFIVMVQPIVRNVLRKFWRKENDGK